MPLDLNLGDVLRLKRPHPCGGTDWQVTRLGADIGLRCLTCNRRVLLERPVLEKRLKQFVSRADPPTPEDEVGPDSARPEALEGPEHVQGRFRARAGGVNEAGSPSPPAGRGQGEG